MAATSSPSSPPPLPPPRTTTPLKIGILGTGNMGRALGIRYAQLGHHVFFGGRSPDGAPRRAAEAANELAGRTSTTTTTTTTTASAAAAKHGTLDEAAAASDVLVWTMRERDPQQVLSSAAIAALSDKVVLDVNNRDYADEVVGTGAGGQGKWFDTSLGEQLQAGLPRAHVLKAFNTVAMEALDTSSAALRAAQAQVFVAGAGAPSAARGRAAVVRLVGELGFEVVDLGGAAAAMRVAEALGDAVRYVMIENGKGAAANLGVRFLPPPDLGIVGVREQSSYH